MVGAPKISWQLTCVCRVAGAGLRGVGGVLP
jgi:hypothetical protein